MDGESTQCESADRFRGTYQNSRPEPRKRWIDFPTPRAPPPGMRADASDKNEQNDTCYTTPRTTFLCDEALTMSSNTLVPRVCCRDTQSTTPPVQEKGQGRESFDCFIGCHRLTAPRRTQPWSPDLPTNPGQRTEALPGRAVKRNQGSK